MAVLIAKRSGDPNDRGRSGASCVGEDLAEVRVIRPLELILNDEHALVGQVSTDQVKAEAANGMLGLCKLKVDAQRVREAISVREQPRCEVMSLVRPHRSNVDRLKPSKVHHETSKAVIAWAPRSLLTLHSSLAGVGVARTPPILRAPG
ncbi:MAG: hypothetical protein ABIV94_02175 [Acidimicrobiales bacterium]